MSVQVAVVGGGPAGLMAAQVCAESGLRVAVFEGMPAPGRKFLVAGHGGLNLTHSEPLPGFAARYGEAAEWMGRLLARFSPGDLLAWARGLGIETITGSSGRVFPREFKAAGLLRAWLDHLRSLGVLIHPRRRWLGWTADGALRFAIGAPDGEEAGGEQTMAAPATVLALGGASWPQTGSDGGWAAQLAGRGVALTAFAPANCGGERPWSAVFLAKAEGRPLKNVAVALGSARGRGELVVTRYGLEGGALYALGPALRAELRRHGRAELRLDLKPDLTADQLARRLARPRGRASWSTHLRKQAGLTPVMALLLRELLPAAAFSDPAWLATAIKDLAVVITGLRPLGEAISSAGGVALAEVDDHLMLRRLPGTFLAGEMLDWEAPTGGYLLQGCFTTGYVAGEGVIAWLRRGVRSPQSGVRSPGAGPRTPDAGRCLDPPGR